MTTNSRPMTSSSVKSIMQKRITVPAQAVGKRVKLMLQGNGNVIDVKDKEGNEVQSVVEPGTVLQKKIFNTRANSALAMGNERNRQYLKDALAAEKAGEAEKAAELFNNYLNATQISFGVLLPSAIVDKLSTGVEIAGTIQKIDTDNGSLLTIDPSTISVVEPEVYGTTTFDLSDFTDEVSDDKTVKAGAEDIEA